MYNPYAGEVGIKLLKLMKLMIIKLKSIRLSSVMVLTNSMYRSKNEAEQPVSVVSLFSTSVGYFEGT